MGVDLAAPEMRGLLGVYGWGLVAVAAVFVVTGFISLLKSKTLWLPGFQRPREAAVFLAGSVTAAALTARAAAAFPVAHSFINLPNWPWLYLVLFAAIVTSGAYLWLRGASLRPWCLFALMLLAAANGQLFNLAVGGFALFFGFAAAVYFYQTETSGPGKPRLSHVGGALLIFLVAAFLSLAFSRDWNGSFRNVYFLTAGFLVFIIFAREIETADVLRVPGGLVWALLVAELAFEAALAAKFVLVSRWVALNVPQENLFWTMGISRNAVSTYFVGALPFLVVAATAAKPPAPRWLLWPQIVLSAAIPALSLSKSGILGLFVVLVLAFTFWGTERRMNLKLMTAGAVAALAVAVVGVVFFLPGGVTRFWNPLTAASRVLMFEVVFEAVKMHPLTGVGLGSVTAWVGQAGVLTPDEMASVPEFLTGHSHSIFLEIPGTMGLPGLLALVIIIQTSVWAAGKLIKIEADRFFFGMVSASLAALGSILTFALGLALLAPLPIILYVGLAMFEGGVRRRGLAGTAPDWLNHAFSVLVVFGAVVGLGFALSRNEIARGDIRFAEGDYRSAGACYERAGKIAFWDPLPRYRWMQAQINLGDLKGALPAARGAVARARGHAGYREAVGLLEWVAGDRIQAGDDLRRSVASDPVGLLGGDHHIYYALYLASMGKSAEAAELLAAAAARDPWLSRDAVFIAAGPDETPRTYLRPITPAELPILVNIRLGRDGFTAARLPRRASRIPADYERSLCLEDIYANEFRDAFKLSRTEYAIATRSAYLLGEGYAETRLRAYAIFPEIEGLPGLRPEDPDVALALFPSSHRDVERRRWELTSLLGMALLARRVGKESAVPEIADEFRMKTAAVRKAVAGQGETAAAKNRRLRYYYLIDEQPDWDLELAAELLAAGAPVEAAFFYERALILLLSDGVSAGDPRIADAVRGSSRSRASAAMGGAAAEPAGFVAGRGGPASYAAAAAADEYVGNYKQALVRLRAGVRRYPRDPDLAMLLAAFCERRGLEAQARAALAAPGLKDDTRILEARAEAAAAAGNRPEALALYGRLEKELPGDVVPYIAAARLYAESGDAARAGAAMARARASIPISSLWASRYAQILIALGWQGDAYFQLAEKLNPFDLEPLIVGGQYLARRGLNAEAEGLLRRAVATEPDSAWACLSLADFYRASGRDADARRTFEAGLPREGLGSPITLAFDDYLKGRGDTRERRRILAAALKRDPANAGIRIRLGEISVAAGDVNGGIKYFHEAVNLEPTSPHANAALGYNLRMRGEAAAAVPYLETARSAVPGTAGDGYRVLLADAYIEVDRPADALKELDFVTEPDKIAKAWYLRAKAYSRMGKRRAAAEAAARALEIDPRLKEAEALIGR